MLPILTILSALAGSAGSGPDFTMEELVEGNQQALGLVHQIELTITFSRQSFLGGKPDGELYTQPPIRWAKKGRLERLRYSTGAAPRDDGRPRGLRDSFSDGSTVKWLENWDWDDPQPITPLEQGTVHARVVPMGNQPIAGQDAMQVLLWRFHVDVGDIRWTLAEFVAKSPRAELLGKTEVDGHEVWHIRAEHPKSNERGREGVSFEFFIDPAVNFAVRKVIEHWGMAEVEFRGQLEKFDQTRTWTVKSFKDCGDGVYVPTLVNVNTFYDTAVTWDARVERRVEDLKVNEPLSEDALDFRFPENVTVNFDPPTDPSHRRVVLWGKDNQPAKEIERFHDLPGFEEARSGALRRTGAAAATSNEARGRNSGTLLWINLGVIALIAALLIIRWFRGGTA